MIGVGSRVLMPGGESTGTVLEIRDNFAQVSAGAQEASWLPIDSLADASDKLLSRLLENDTDSPLKFILATDANRLMTKYRFDPYVLASSTKITIYPHQINEVMWGIDNPRIMIADEVGLGKTIIAALIVSELKARGLADRVLYVVPSPLVLKWKDELETKFETDVEILDANYVRFNRDPFSVNRYNYVTSMDFLKQENRIKLLKELDMVVVDEVHKFKPDNERYALGQLLSEKSDNMIFLTATPHDGKDENFLARMQLLDPLVADVTATGHLWKRHIKEDVVDINGREVFPKRTSTTVNTELTNNERRVHYMIDDYISSMIQEAGSAQDRAAAHLLAVILKKRAASSLQSLRITLDRRKNNVGTTRIRSVRDSDSMETEIDYEDHAEEYEYARIGTSDIEREKSNIAEIISAIDALATDSKFGKLVEFIKKVKDGDAKAKILLFSEYRDTLDHLEEGLGGRYNTGRIDGTMDMQSRKNTLHRFSQDDGPEILLCTDAAGEGVDMQFCNVEFNYDIPWNPNRLEQRMGRVHRIGQRNKVYYYNFVVDRDNTIDGMIHAKLLDKIENIKAAMGSDSVFDIMGRFIPEDMIRKVYEELRMLPHDRWEPQITAKLEEIERTRESVKKKIGGLMDGNRLDRTILENIKEIKRRAVDSGDVRRFLESWTECNGGAYEEHAGDRIRIIAPAHMASAIGGMVNGTLNVEEAQEHNMEYLALGNRNVQSMLEDAAGDGSVALLGHAKRSGLLCVYNRSVIDGDGRSRNSETAMIFCNEDGTAEVVDVDSIWDYTDPPDSDKRPPTKLMAELKKHADMKMDADSKEFHDKTADKLGEMRRKARDAVDLNVTAEIEKQKEKIAVWESKKHAAPHYARLISEAERKIRNRKDERDKRKDELDGRFDSHLMIELVGLAIVIPHADVNARTQSDMAGMKIVLEREKRRAKTDEERECVKDVSNRDTGYDVETSDRSIEVKSFEGYPNPILTSHEWSTAEKFGDRYWLYVVERVHEDGRVTEIQNPHKKLTNLIKKETSTTDTYTFNWSEWKRMSDATDMGS